MPQIQGVKGEAVVIYREPLTTQEMRSEFPKIAQEDRKVRLLLLFRTFCHVIYATLGSTFSMPPHAIVGYS
jgi:hypothetical protein